MQYKFLVTICSKLDIELSEAMFDQICSNIEASVECDDQDTVLEIDSVDVESISVPKYDLMSQLSSAEIIGIDYETYSSHQINIREDAFHDDDIALEADAYTDSYIFTKYQIDSARKVGNTWLVPTNEDEDEEIRVTLYKTVAF